MTITITPITIDTTVTNNPINANITQNVINAECQGNFPITLSIGGLPPPISFRNYTAGEAISGHTAVTVGTDGKVYAASPLFYQPIAGVTMGAVENGGSVRVQDGGVLSMIGWSFDINKPVFVLSNGALSTTADPSASYNMAVGISVSPTSLMVGIQPLIKL